MNKDQMNSIKQPAIDFNFMSGHSVDCVVLGFENGELKVLLLKWKLIERWALPGGFIGEEEDMDEAATRILQDRTGVNLPFLEQFHSFGRVKRKNKESYINEIKELIGENESFSEWMDQRFISTGYLSLVDVNKCNLVPDDFSELCEWVSLDKIPKLIFDHNEILLKALHSIQLQLNYLPIGITLLGEKFTLKELRLLYESILQKKLDRGNFQKKMLKLEILIRLEKQNSGGAHKAPYLYMFDKDKYRNLLERGFGFIN